jgi:hypothetical protein
MVMEMVSVVLVVRHFVEWAELLLVMAQEMLEQPAAVE